MKLAICSVLALLASQQAAARRTKLARDEHPITGVIDMLKELKEKVIEEHKEEEKAYAKYERWCSNSVKDLKKAVKEGKEEIETLEDKVEAKAREEEMLTEEIDELDKELTKAAADQKKADDARKDEEDLFKEADKDLGDTIKAIGDAIKKLDTAKPALVQETMDRLRLMPLLALQLGDKPDILADGDFKNAQKDYKSKTGGVIDLLKGLKMKFEDDQVEGTKAETAAQNAYDVAKAARDAAIEAATDTKTQKETMKGDAETAKNEANSTLGNERDDLKADKTSLSDTEQACSMKAEEWKERQKVRYNEKRALDAGVEILAKVTGVRTEKPKNPVPPTAPAEAGDAFLQSNDPFAKALTLLKAEAKQSHSTSFAHFVEQLAMRKGSPFDQVINKIQKMVFRLMSEQKDEDEHKNWCDLELKKTEISEDDKKDKIKTLEAKLDDDKARVALLAEEIVEQDEFVGKLAEHIAEATEIRQESKAENEKALKDAKAAQEAIAQAQAVLLEFYKDSGKVEESLLQRKGGKKEPVTLPDEPSTWDASYTGAADPTNQPDGIVAILKTISADFATMEAETLAQEETDQRAFNEDIKAAEIDKARRAKESEMKLHEKERMEEKIVSLESSLKHTNKELDAVKQYLEDLQPACVEGDSTYEERKADREKEIEALKKAQVMLQDYKNGPTEAPELAQMKMASFLKHK